MAQKGREGKGEEGRDNLCPGKEVPQRAPNRDHLIAFCVGNAWATEFATGSQY